MEMVRHTFVSLAPKVLATRMVRDYVNELYVPATSAGRSLGANGATELSEWKARVASGWHAVRVEHVESDGAEDVAEIGTTLSVRAFVALGDLAPDDVAVQLVAGRADSDDRISEPQLTSLVPLESYEGGRSLFAGSVSLDRSGPFGYTVRVVPRNAHLASPAELGLIALA
jgi:starch phosphorylase